MATISEQVSAEVLRIQTARNDLRSKAVELGIANSTADIDDLASAFGGVENRGSVSANVREGETYAIPKGYHDGSGTVSGVAGGGNYSLQSKNITPTKAQQTVTADSGYYGLSDVTVKPIPDNYQDVTSVTAGAADVLVNKVIVDATGKSVAGTMPNNGAVSQTLTPAATSYTVPKGYHSGTGTVKIVTEEKTATPTKSAQDITPTSGKVLSKVTVNPIPDNFIDTTDADAVAGEILNGKIAYVDGVRIKGTMPNNSGVSQHLTTTTYDYIIPEGYHDGKGHVSISLETQTATPTKAAQYITPRSGNVLSRVTVTPIPDEYQDVTGVTAGAADVLDGKHIVTSDGTLTAGTMANNGDVSATFDPLSQDSVTIPAGYTTGGTVTMTEDLLNALKAI